MKSEVMPPNLFFIASSTVLDGSNYLFLFIGNSFLSGLYDNFYFSLIESDESKSF